MARRLDELQLHPRSPAARDRGLTTCLRHDFDLDMHELALILIYLDRIRDLEAQLQDLRARLPHWLR